MGRYDNIKTLEDLRLERMRINEKIEYKEENLLRRYNAIKTFMSLDGIVGYMTSGLTSVSSLVGYVHKGYDFITSIMNMIRTKAKRKEPVAGRAIEIDAGE